jgi:predicted nuclease of predicted toxin-antitoxin system
MRILADENCDRLTVMALREAGHDVLYVAETCRGEDDLRLFRLAAEQSRILLTNDLDFGLLVENLEPQPPAVILARLDPLGRSARTTRIVAVIGSLENSAEGRLIVIEPTQLRLRELKPIP